MLDLLHQADLFFIPDELFLGDERRPLFFRVTFGIWQKLEGDFGTGSEYAALHLALLYLLVIDFADLRLHFLKVDFRFGWP